MDSAESHATPDLDPEAPAQQDSSTQEHDGRRRIGEIFVELGFISSSQLEAALDVQQEKGGRIGEILVAQGSLTRLDLASALAEHWEPHRSSLPKAGRGGAGSIDTRSRVEQDHATIAGLEERLRVAEERLGTVEGAAAKRGNFGVRKRMVIDPQERLAHVDQLIAALATLNLRVATLEQRDSVRESDAAATGARFASAEAALEKRLESVEGRSRLIAELEEAFDALGLRLRALEASAASSSTELADRLRAREDEASRLAEAFESLRREVEAGRAAGESAISSLEVGAGSVGVRVEELRDLHSADAQELRRSNEQLSTRLDDLARRLEARDAIQEERVVTAERTLLEEVSALRSTVEAFEGQRGGKKKKRKHRGDDAPS